MTKDQLSQSLALALSDADLSKEDEPFMGFGLPDFQPLVCTIPQVARLIRWQCIRLNGSIDSEALNEIADAGRKKFQIVG